MSKGVEIYLRPLEDKAILNIHVPTDVANEFARTLQAGSFSGSTVPIAFEMSVAPHWFTSIGDHHVRVGVRRKLDS